jgi:alkanesulfonate monooxygenase SsuD/methylene tetrahydromethanopterin reductase-like flavin-dependent oxidoreductase (luciferase family)
MRSTDQHVRFGLGLENGVHQVSEMLAHARLADEGGLDFVSFNDHPYFADRFDAYAALSFALGATSNVTGAVIVTNLLSRPAPVLARTIATLSEVSGRRVILGLGASGLDEEMVALGVPRLSPGERVRALEETILVVKALSGGGEPVTFDGEFTHVTELAPARTPSPPVWLGVGGPKGLAVAGRQADGWIPPHGADWRSAVVSEGRPIIDAAAEASGRDPADIGNVYLVTGAITAQPQAVTRNAAGRWNGGGISQWVEELTYAVFERGAIAFNYVVRPGDSVSDATASLWAQEVVPAVREAVAKELSVPATQAEESSR